MIFPARCRANACLTYFRGMSIIPMISEWYMSWIVLLAKKQVRACKRLHCNLVCCLVFEDLHVLLAETQVRACMRLQWNLVCCLLFEELHRVGQVALSIICFYRKERVDTCPFTSLDVTLELLSVSLGNISFQKLKKYGRIRSQRSLLFC